MSTKSKVAIGTAQFGMPYGLTNESGKVAPLEVSNILQVAKQSGLSLIDTAVDYGSAHGVLGEVGVEGFHIVTKIGEIKANSQTLTKTIERIILEAIEKLKVETLYGVLFHRTETLIGSNGKKFLDVLTSMQRHGIVEKLGVSIYDPNELSSVFKIFDPEIIQTPLSVVDQRFINSTWSRVAESQKIEVHARSVYLQGALIQEVSKLPKYFEPWAYKIEEFQKMATVNGLTYAQAALAFALRQDIVSNVIVGVLSSSQLNEVLDEKTYPEFEFAQLAVSDPRLLNPSLWLRK